jgi:hypothetical protein
MTRRQLRRGVLILVALASELALASGASAAISLVFDRARAAPGERITARQPGRVFGESSSDIKVYLVPIAIAAKVSTNPDGSRPRLGGPPNDRRIVPIGKLVTRRGIARVVFHVPRVRRGRYTTPSGASRAHRRTAASSRAGSSTRTTGASSRLRVADLTAASERLNPGATLNFRDSSVTVSDTGKTRAGAGGVESSWRFCDGV